MDPGPWEGWPHPTKRSQQEPEAACPASLSSTNVAQRPAVGDVGTEHYTRSTKKLLATLANSP